MRILVTGAGGQLGSEILRCLKDGYSVLGELSSDYEQSVVSGIRHDELDIGDPNALTQWFAQREPFDLVINCAAMTNVDGCEKEEARAYHVNALGPEALARTVQATGGKLVHVSTDYVFSGVSEKPYQEEDAVCPVSAYGRSKWAGEVLVRAACHRTFIVRTAWLYGAVGKNFVKTMLRLARNNGVIRVVNDQIGCPTCAADLAYAILRLAATESYGTYHGTNLGACSWFDFASRVMDLMKVDCERCGITSTEYKSMFPESAERPAYSCLSSEKLQKATGMKMRSWEEALKHFLEMNDL